jgi:hydroxymethylpyrimidine/phosphomethylpyrimidine kinase
MTEAILAGEARAGRPVVLTIAGSDCSAGAGIQADLKTFGAFGVHGLTAVTCAVSETAAVVERIEVLPAEFAAAQVRLMLDSFPVAAVKTGMLFSAAHIAAVAGELAGWGGALVVDPVMVASTGDPLLEPAAVAAYREWLLPRARVITPNLDEAAVLLGWRVAGEDQLERAARELAGAFGCAVLLKGGHLKGARAIDLLLDSDGALHRFEAPFIAGVATHGTGCTYSAALAAGLALGRGLADAAAAAKEFVTAAIRGGLVWHGARGPVAALDQLVAR